MICIVLKKVATVEFSCRVYTTSFLLVLSAVLLNGQDEKQLSPKQLIKDFEQFESFIEAHPDPYTHISKESFNRELRTVRNSLNEPHSQLEFYNKLCALVALIKDGHSSVLLPSTWRNKERKEQGVFPYEVHLTNENELYIIKQYGHEEIPLGAKILTINEMPLDEFLATIDPMISYEKLTFRNTVIDGDFQRFLYMVFGVKNQVQLKIFSSDTSIHTIDFMPLKDWKKYDKSHEKTEREEQIKKGKPYSYRKIQDGVGLLNIYAFSVSDYGSYRRFLAKTFKSIRQDSIHSLIIDIRGNFGGWPKIASSLFHYLTNKPFKTMAQSSMRVSSAYKKQLLTGNAYLRHNRPRIINRRHYVNLDAIIHQPEGTYVHEDVFFNELMEREENEYRGDVYLLTNRDSYSAASSFASTFQCYRMGVIIGEETGGTKIFRANPIVTMLKKSKIYVRMSTTKLYTACFNEEFEGVFPNIEYAPSILELTSDMDTQLLFAMRIIKEIRKRHEEQQAER